MLLKLKKAFTLVELLVVMTILGVLMGLLMVGLNAGRSAARQAQCTDRQRNIGMAIQTFVSAKGTIPGYINNGGKSWPVQILPHLGEENRFKAITENLSAPTVDTAYAPLAAFFCPNAKEFSVDPSPSLSYVGNCGFWDDVTDPAKPVFKYGLFSNRLNPAATKKITLDGISDGTSNTILLSENGNAGTWRLETDPTTMTEKNIAELWGGNSGFRWTSTAKADFPKLRFNSKAPDGVDWSLPANLFLYARPSSAHSGIVIATYADGSVKPISDDIESSVYVKECCPNDAVAEKDTALIP